MQYLHISLFRMRFVVTLLHFIGDMNNGYKNIQRINYICQLGGPYSENLWPTSWKCARSQFFTVRTDPKSANNMLIFSCGKLAYKWVCLCNCVYPNRLTCRLHIAFVKIFATTNLDTRHKCLVQLVHHLSSTKSFFRLKFSAEFEVVLTKQFLSVVANHLKSGFYTVN